MGSQSTWRFLVGAGLGDIADDHHTLDHNEAHFLLQKQFLSVQTSFDSRDKTSLRMLWYECRRFGHRVVYMYSVRVYTVDLSFGVGCHCPASDWPLLGLIVVAPCFEPPMSL